MHSPVRVGIIGAGTSATTFHAPFITSNPSYKLVKFHRSSQAPVPGHEKLPVVTDLSSFLSSPPEIDLVIITTPTNTHYQLARACLDAGMHVVLEKPMTAAYDDAKELCSLARTKNKLLAVYQNRRWDGDFQTVEKLIGCGALGRVVEFESHFDRFRNTVKPGWKEQDLPGSGILYDLGAHLIDQALCLFGPPTSLTAHILNQRQLPASTVPDAFTLILHYEAPSSSQTSHLEFPQVPSGKLPTPIENLAGNLTSPMSHRPLTVILRAGMLTKIPGPRYVIHGTQGSYIKQGLDVQEEQLREGLSPTAEGFGVEQSDGFGTLDSLALDQIGTLDKAALDQIAELDTPTAVPAAASAAAMAGSFSSKNSGRVEGVTANVGAIAAGVLAKVDSGGVAAAGSSSSGAVIKVETERGCWMEFYNNVAEALRQQQGLEAEGVVADAPAGSTTAAAASSSGSGGLNSMLAVKPEQGAEVIRLIEAAMQSSSEGRTVRLV